MGVAPMTTTLIKLKRKDDPEIRRAWARAWWNKNREIMKVARGLKVPVAEARRICGETRSQ